jgi:GT2 family glycosyltransferase
VRGVPTVLATHCVRSIVSASTYDAYEIVCVADVSTDAAVIDELRDVGGERLRVIDYDRPFNFSAKINLGARGSDGEHLLLLNDDMEVVTPDWIERLVMYAGHEGIGAVGARLLREDGRIQHAGVVFEDGLPGHVYRDSPPGFTGYERNAIAAQNYLAVTGACLMTPRAAFEEASGFDEELPVNYNDMDYCLKLRERGRRVVYDPDTVLYHFESSSRSSSGVARTETDWLLDRWRGLTEPDPFSNQNLRYGKPRSRSLRAWLSTRLRRWLR